MTATKPFWQKPLAELSDDEWEALCDGCGRCCLHKLEDEDDGEVYYTRVACRLLNVETGRCRDYAHRQQLVPDCTVLTHDRLERFEWLPETCAYRLRAAGQPLPDWHPLVSGRAETVIAAGVSIVGKVISEREIDLEELENYLIEGF